jgi:uncharacterized protein YjiS (DUF1127 family)
MYSDTLPIAEPQTVIAGLTTGPTGSRQAIQDHEVMVATARSAGFLERWAAGLKAARIRRKTIARLSALDDRQLTDIGMERSQIGTAVDGALLAAEAGATAAASAAHRITDGAGPPSVDDNGPEAANDNGPEVEDSFEAAARQWRERRPAKATGGQPG